MAIGQLRAERRADLISLVEESIAVSHACGALAGADVVVHDALPPAIKSSMQRDAEAGRPWNWMPSVARCYEPPTSTPFRRPWRAHWSRNCPKRQQTPPNQRDDHAR